MLIYILAYLLTFYFIYSVFTTFNEVTYVTSDIDNKVYTIRTGKTKSETYLKDSANALATINKNIEHLIDHLTTKYPDRIIVRKLRESYNQSILSEAAIDKRYTTYTVDKSDMHICLRTRDKNEDLYDTNLLMYVVLHELAHLCNYDDRENPIHGHGIEFIEIFRTLVKESIALGIYTYENYKTTPREYCGIIINSQIV